MYGLVFCVHGARVLLPRTDGPGMRMASCVEFAAVLV